MMQSLTKIILLAAVVHVSVQELGASDAKESGKKVVDKLVGRLFDNLLKASSLDHSELDHAILEKPAEYAAPRAAKAGGFGRKAGQASIASVPDDTMPPEDPDDTMPPEEPNTPIRRTGSIGGANAQEAPAITRRASSMNSQSSNAPSSFSPHDFQSVAKGLQHLYAEKLLKVEKFFHFHHFHSAEWQEAHFSRRPIVLLIGQYSTGKSTFVRHLLGKDYPGIRIGPEPTTDKFVSVSWGDTDQVIPGHSLVHDPTLPFMPLNNFGGAFLTRLAGAKMSSVVLEGISLIDTPGVLSGDKQATKRGYDFEGVVKWFAENADMILLLFDAHKLDISDEFKRCIQALKGNDQKIHIVLNKADQVTSQQLIRVHGALMWSLGRIIEAPEVVRVYVGSFWDGPLLNEDQRKLFRQEEYDLYTHISQLPRESSWNKVNDMIKRTRLLKAHALLMDHLSRAMPVFGKAKAKEKLIQDLPQIYRQVAKKYDVPLGDFPGIQRMQEKLTDYDFTKLKVMDKAKMKERMDALDTMLNYDVPALLKMIPAEQEFSKDCLPGITGGGG